VNEFEEELARSSELTGLRPSQAEIYSMGAAFYVALLKNGKYDEAAEFAEWFIDTFDIDLET